MDIKQLTDDVKAGQIDEFRLLDLVVAQAAIIQKLEKRIAELERGP